MQGDNHTVVIGSKTTIGGASFVCCGTSKTIIKIGKSCMLASEIDIRTCDGHTIYCEDKIINLSKNIIIHDNVWVTKNVTILKGTNILKGCIVGTGSVLTGKTFESKSIVAGNPAKIIKKDITWGRENIC